MPAGLSDYLTPHEAPPGMPRLAAFLGAQARGSQPTARQWFNAGLALRWSVGLTTLERYSALPEDAVARFTSAWVQHVHGLVAMHAPHLQLLAVSEGTAEGHFAGGVNAIVSVSVHVPAAGGLRPLTMDECKVFHQMMTQAVALSDGTTAEGHTRVMLGQPVKLSEATTVVRIALGADMVVDALSSSSTAEGGVGSAGMRRVLSEDVQVVQKMALLARQWEALTSTSKGAVATDAGGATAAATASGTRSHL